MCEEWIDRVQEYKGHKVEVSSSLCEDCYREEVGVRKAKIDSTIKQEKERALRLYSAIDEYKKYCREKGFVFFKGFNDKYKKIKDLLKVESFRKAYEKSLDLISDFEIHIEKKEEEETLRRKYEEKALELEKKISYCRKKRILLYRSFNDYWEEVQELFQAESFRKAYRKLGKLYSSLDDHIKKEEKEKPIRLLQATMMNLRKIKQLRFALYLGICLQIGLIVIIGFVLSGEGTISILFLFSNSINIILMFGAVVLSLRKKHNLKQFRIIFGILIGGIFTGFPLGSLITIIGLSYLIKGKKWFIQKPDKSIQDKIELINHIESKLTIVGGIIGIMYVALVLLIAFTVLGAIPVYFGEINGFWIVASIISAISCSIGIRYFEKIKQKFSKKITDVTGGKKIDDGKYHLGKSMTQSVKIECPKCGSSISITSNKRPLVIKCNNCGARGFLQ